MRRALAISDKDVSKYITTDFLEEGYGYFGFHAGYDYGVVRWTVRAPEAGTIINVWTGRETVDGGNIVEMQGQYTHRFLHLQSASVKVGQKVSEGQELGITGNTGNVGFHLHHDVRKNGTAWTASYANYVDWEQLIKGENMATITIEAVVAESKATTGKSPSTEQEKYYIGKEASQANLDGFITYWAGRSRIPTLEAELAKAQKEVQVLKDLLAKEHVVLGPGKYLIK